MTIDKTGHCEHCGLTGTAAVKAEQIAVTASRTLRHPDCQHVMVYWLVQEREQVTSKAVEC